MNLKGTLPLLILSCLETGPKYGYLIASEIKLKSKGTLDFREGTLYPALHEHERNGLIESYEQVESGRLRRYYRLTEKGKKVLTKGREEWKQVSGAVSLILEGA